MPSSEYNVNITITTKDKTSAAAKTAEKSLFTLANAAKAAALAYAALRTAQKALEFVKLGAEVQMAEKRLVAFAGGVEQATKYMEALAAGSDNTIDRLTGLAQASRMLETGMVTNAREMELAAAMVAKLGNQARSTESRMQMLTLLLANQSVLRLDEFGLSIDRVRERQEALEKQGRSTTEAFRAAVFAEAEEKLAVLGDTSATTATKIGQVAAAWKTMVQTIAATAAQDIDPAIGNMAQNLRDLTLLYEGLAEISKRETVGFKAPEYTPLWQEYEQENQTLIELILSTKALQQTRAVAAATAAEWQEDEEELRKRLEETNAATREAERLTNAQAFATRLMTDSVANSLSTLGGLDQTMLDFVGTLTQGSTMASGFSKYVDDGSLSLREQTAAAAQASFAIMDLASSYASYMQQVAYSYTDYAGSMAEIEAQYQKTIEGITSGGGGAGGGAAAAARAFDRPDIERGLNILQLQLKELQAEPIFDTADAERGLNILQLQLKELEAERAGWEESQKKEDEPVFWYEMSRQDRKWLMESGKTLEDLALKHEQEAEEISELERAQMDDRIEDLKTQIAEANKLIEAGGALRSALEDAQAADRIADLEKEIADTKELLERGHYEEHTARVAWAQRDTAALLAEAQTRRDAQIAALEKSQAREEEMNRQSLGRIKLAAFDHWLSMQEDTDTWTKAQWDAVEKMRLNIMTEYGLLTPALLAETIKWQEGFDSMFLAVTTGAKSAVSEIQLLIDKLKEIPAEKRIKIITEIIKEESPGITVPELTKQHGGPVKAGMPYIVGEAGPELFVPGSSGQIVNNSRTEHMIGSHNTYNITDPQGMAFLGAAERARARNAFASASGM